MTSNTNEVARQIADDPRIRATVITNMAKEAILMRRVLRDIAAQKLSEELEQGPDEGDFVEGYDTIVRLARAALTKVSDC